MTVPDVEAIDQASLRILEQIGVRLEHDEVVARVLAAGARPGLEAGVVRFPRGLVEECLARCPRQVRLDDRRGGGASLTAGSPSVFWTNPAMNIQEDGQVRPATTGDLVEVARLCDRLPGVAGVMGLSLADLPPAHRDFVGVRLIAENCRCHVRALCATPAGMEALLAMRQVLPGNWLSVGFTAHGPLRWTNLALGIFLRSAGAGIPATINGEPMAGVTGPVSLAACAALGNAEILSGIVVNQVLEPGRPLIHNLGLAHVFDMRDATAVTGGPENALLAAVGAALGRFYQLPSASWASTDSVHEDAQASLEKMLAFSAHTGSGVSLIWGLGQLESEKTISLAQLVIDDEMVSCVRRYQRGLGELRQDESLELIRRVGIGGSYLETEDTLERWREHLWVPGILNRRPRERSRGPLQEEAGRRARELLAADREEAIGPPERIELRRIEERFRRRIG